MTPNVENYKSYKAKYVCWMNDFSGLGSSQLNLIDKLKNGYLVISGQYTSDYWCCEIEPTKESVGRVMLESLYRRGVIECFYSYIKNDSYSNFWRLSEAFLNRKI